MYFLDFKMQLGGMHLQLDNSSSGRNEPPAAVPDTLSCYKLCRHPRKVAVRQMSISEQNSRGDHEAPFWLVALGRLRSLQSGGP